MNSTLMNRTSWLALGVLWLAYAFLGWYLAAHHIFWLIGAIIVAVVLMVTRTGISILKQVSWLSSQEFFMTIMVALTVTVCTILFVTDFQFLGLIFLPTVAMFWADLELRSTGFDFRQVVIRLVAIASLGIIFGELVDLLFIPSIRY